MIRANQGTESKMDLRLRELLADARRGNGDALWVLYFAALFIASIVLPILSAILKSE